MAKQSFINIVLVDEAKDEENIYTVLNDKKYDKNITKLEKLLENYKSFEEIDSFVCKNFNLTYHENNILYY